VWDVQWLDAGGLPLGNSQLAVPLHWNAGHWRITRRELTAPATAAYARLIIGAKVEADTLWVDDVAFVPAPEPEVTVMGNVALCPTADMMLDDGPQTVVQRPPFALLGPSADTCLIQAVTLETTPLGLSDPTSALMTDIAITQTLPFSLTNGDIRFSLTLAPQQTRVFRVSGGILQSTPTLPPTPTPTPTPTATGTHSPCADNAVGLTPEPACLIYLPVVLHELSPSEPTPSPTPTTTFTPTPTITPSPTPTSSPTSTATPTASLALTVAAGSDLGDLSHLTGGHINLNNFDQTVGALNDLQSLLGLENRLVRIHYALRWWADEPEDRSRMTDRVSWVLEQGGVPQLDLFAFPPSWTGCPGDLGSDLCKGYPPQNLAHFRQQMTDLVRQVYLPAFAAHPDAPHIYELLNEPDLPQFWNGTRQQYLDTLTVLKDSILTVDSGARFAGPAAVGLTTTIQGETTAVSQDFIDWFLGTGLPHDRLVAFTFHTYYPSVQAPLLGNLAALRQHLDDQGLAATGILLDEWNHHLHDPILDTPANAAFAVRRLATYADLPLAAHTFFKLADSRDAWPHQPFTARLGLLTSYGLRKPVFQGMRLAAMLGDTRLAATPGGDWTERSVLAGRDITGTVSVLIASGGELTGTLPTARLDLTFTDLTAAHYDVEVYRVDAGHANAYGLVDEITAAYQSIWNDHLVPVRQALLDAGYLPDVVDPLIASLQTDPEGTLSQLQVDDPGLYAATIAALGAERPGVDADLESLATGYNHDPRLVLAPETNALTPVDGRADLRLTLPAEGVVLVRLDAGADTIPATGTTMTTRAPIVVDAAEVTGTIRSLQGINAGPRGEGAGWGQRVHLFQQYRDIGVDYVRTHDYGGPADMDVIFPDLSADPNDENSYHFAVTDRELEAIKRVGAGILFRLGYSWGDPHAPVTYVAPADRDVWAQAAVHIARHYNDGWADGFHWDVEYWEVWNEPDFNQFWIGTPKEYFQLYEAVARALKDYDPTLKVGGPSWCCNHTFFRDFLAYVRDHQVPLDFVSWHYYGSPKGILERAQAVQAALDAYSFTDTENLFTEWNISPQGEYEHLYDANNAAYTAVVLSHLQDTSVSIANRYRGDGGLGIFTQEGFYTKPAYSFLAFRRLLKTPQRLAAEGPWTYNWSALAGRDEAGETVQVLISNYTSQYTDFDLTVNNLPWGAGQPYRYERYLLDETHNLTLVESADVPAGSATFTTGEAMTAPSVQLIRLFVPAGEPLPRITVHADQTLDAISPLLYGINHDYADNAIGIWNPDAGQVYATVITHSLEMGLAVVRFPTGSGSDLYHWTDGIGPPEQRPDGIGAIGQPVSNTYGFDEHMLFVEQIGATANVVVNFGTGTAQEAAAWVAYANGAVTDTRRIGVDHMGGDWGTVRQWAIRRELNQVRLGMIPHPYNITYWEVDNELFGDWEHTWTHSGVKYAAGGTAWQYNEKVVRETYWEFDANESNGLPHQVFYVRYPPVVTGTQTITVGNEVWTQAPNLADAGPDDPVYEFDPLRGEIRFGDGSHGRIPPKGAPLLATYESGPHDGFVDYYEAMKAVDPHIKVGSCFYLDNFLAAMGEEYPYDFVVVHPYLWSGAFHGGGLAEAHLRTMAGPLIKRMDLEDLRAGIRLYAGARADQVEIAATEYNFIVLEDYTPTRHYGMSLDQGLYIADMLRHLIEMEVPLGNLHSLTTYAEGEEWMNTAALSPYPHFIRRPEAYVLELFSHHFAPVPVGSEVEGAPLLTGSMPALEAAASIDETGERLTLLAINKDATMPITATVAISGFTPAPEATVRTLNGPEITAYNNVTHPISVTIAESSVTDAAENFVYTFPAHSVTLIELQAPPPTSRCVGDANGNRVGDIVDIMTTASDVRCLIYLPVVAANWHQPWPTPTPGHTTAGR